MSEKQMWVALKSVIKSLDPVRIENVLAPGTPDVNYSHGWIEMKYIEQWPVRETTEVKVDHFTTDQRSWLLRRHLRGGRTWLMLKVGLSEWLLFQGHVAARILGHATQKQLFSAAVARWARKPKPQELIPWLIQ